MKTTSTTILTAVGAGHRETELYINWNGLTQDQLQTLAQRAVVAAIQQDYKANDSAPDKDVVEAAWFVDRSFPSPIRVKKPSELPKHLQGKADVLEVTKVDKAPTVSDLASRLTPEEKAAIINLLKGG